MTRIYVRHNVADFVKWKAVYDGLDPIRKQFGITKAEVFKNANDANDILVIHEWDNKEQAMKFMGSQDLKNAMAHGGVLSTPEVNFAE